MNWTPSKSVQKRTRYTVEEFTRPEIRQEESDRYAAIEENGLPRIGSLVREGRKLEKAPEIMGESVNLAKSLSASYAKKFLHRFMNKNENARFHAKCRL